MTNSPDWHNKVYHNIKSETFRTVNLSIVPLRTETKDSPTKSETCILDVNTSHPFFLITVIYFRRDWHFSR